ncbi:MAG: hypothetical protein ACXADX_06235 [Candidatus Hodarchaeales archaeon]|jgi:hypothetical protein
MTSGNGEVLRTYKAGLKLPASLLDPFKQLVREREIFQFLLKYPNKFSKKQSQQLREVAAKYRTATKQKWEGFRAYKNLIEASKAIQNEYKEIFTQYEEKPLQDLEYLLQENQKKLEFFKRSNLQYDASLTLKGLIEDPAKPTPTEISLHDYQTLARKYFKQLCGKLRHYAVENIERLPLDEKLTERKVTTLLGNKANHLHSVATQMATMMNVGNNARQKATFVKVLLQADRDNGSKFRDVLPIYLSFYSVPTHFRNYLAIIWQVDGQWVRNTLVGWRRKIDPLLPPKVQIEPLTAFMEDLARYCGKFCSDERERKILGILQQKRVLHLVPTNIPLHALLPPKYRSDLDSLQGKIVFSQEMREKVAAVTSSIDLTLFVQLTGELSDKIREHMAAFEEGAPCYKRTQTFLHKLVLLKAHMAAFQILLHNYLPGNRYTASAAKIILHTLNEEGKNRRGIKRLFTALRGVIAPAFAHLYPEATAQFGDQFTPDHCVTRPFTSTRKNPKKYLPLELKSPKYVILRKKDPTEKRYLNTQDTTELFKTNHPLWVGFNLYTPDQFRANGTLNGRHKGTLWFRLFPTKKIRECVQKGAVVKAIRLNVPRGATNKMVADIILGATSRTPFRHSVRFLQRWEAQFPNIIIPKSIYLGQDLNRLGKDMLALGTDQRELDISALMAEFDREYQKLELFRQKLIPALQRNLIRKKDGKNGRRKTEITNLHNKRGKIMHEYNQRVLMVYLYAIWKAHARHVAWDGIEGLTSRGKKGAFAAAVQSLPNNRDQFALFHDWLDDLQHLKILLPETQIHVVSPFTSAVCPLCYAKSGKRNKNRDKTTTYHEFKCKQCGYTGNRHSTAAMVEAVDMKHTIEGIP